MIPAFRVQRILFGLIFSEGELYECRDQLPGADARIL